MAIFRFESALGVFGKLSDAFDLATLTMVGRAAKITITDQFGAGAVLTGSGFTYDSDGVPTGGTITAIRFHDEAGNALVRVEGSFTASSLFKTYLSAGFTAAVDKLFAKSDLLVGSAIPDVLWAGDGDDTIRGGRGGDVVDGQAGNDRLRGGAGADWFVFLEGGNDRILDMSDSDGRGDDLIVVTNRMFKNMIVREVARGVELDFGAKGHLLVDGWTASQVGADDFLLL